MGQGLGFRVHRLAGAVGESPPSSPSMSSLLSRFGATCVVACGFVSSDALRFRRFRVWGSGFGVQGLKLRL